MTESDWESFRDRMAELWPGRINAEQARCWKAFVLKLPAYEAESALTAYFASPKTPADGPQPSLPGFMRVVRAARDADRRRDQPMQRGGTDKLLSEPVAWQALLGEVHYGGRVDQAYVTWAAARRRAGKDVPSMDEAVKCCRRIIDRCASSEEVFG